MYLPELHEHLSKHKIPTDIYASNWFITMFTNDLPFDMAPSVLDVYLLEGHKGLLRISLSILSFLKSELLNLPYDELMVFLSHPNARESIFRSLDQYWLFQTSFSFKITQSLLDQLHRLYIVREKLANLKPKVLKNLREKRNEDRLVWTEEDLQSVEGGFSTERSKVSPADRLVELFNLLYFTKLRPCIVEGNIRRRHEWHILMLGPDDVDNLMNNEGLPTDDIEKLRVFYNAEIKDKGLKTVLTIIELAIANYECSEGMVPDFSEVLTPRQGSNVESSQDIAQENYLRATNKMQVNATNNSVS